MKSIKRNLDRDEEMWIGDMLDRVDEEKLLEISAIHSDIPLPVPNQEKLAQSVIDKADLADGEELARRRAFAKAYRRKKMLHGSMAACAVLVVFAVLALCGVFDRVYLPKYAYTIEAAAVYNGAEADSTPQFDGQSIVQAPGCGVGRADVPLAGDSLPEVKEDKLENTAYDAVADYCGKHQYAVDEHKVLRYWYYKDRNKIYVMCEIAASFVHLDKSPEGKKAEEQEETSVRAQKREETPETLADYLALDLNRVMPKEGLDSTQGAAVFLLVVEA